MSELKPVRRGFVPRRSPHREPRERRSRPRDRYRPQKGHWYRRKLAAHRKRRNFDRRGRPLKKRFPKLPIPPLIGLAAGVGYIAYELVRVNDPAFPNRYPQSGFWKKRAGDYNVIPYYPLYTDGFRRAQEAWHTNISGQAISGSINAISPLSQPVWDIDPTWDQYGYWWRLDTGSVVRHAHHSSYDRVQDPAESTSHSTEEIYKEGGLTPFPWSSPDPNIMRRSPADPSFDQTPDPPDPRPWEALEIGFRPNGRTPPRPPRQHQRQRPKKNEKEGKVKIGALAANLFGFLDFISESAEVVDAIYQALPQDVRDRWENGRVLDRGLFDNAGQYGIDGADWKLRAIYHNFHRLDLTGAVYNILLNEIEDRLYGRAYAAKDKLTGRGRYRRRSIFTET